jgi:aconitate hydratase
MGVLPLQFAEGTTPQSLGLDGSEVFSITGLSETIKPAETITLEVQDRNRPASAKATADRQKRSIPVKLRIDTPIEIDYYRHGGILPFVLRQLLAHQ